MENKIWKLQIGNIRTKQYYDSEMLKKVSEMLKEHFPEHEVNVVLEGAFYPTNLTVNTVLSN